MSSLAKRIAKDGYIEALQIGVAAQSLNNNSDKWTDRCTEAEVLQELKMRWHVLVELG